MSRDEVHCSSVILSVVAARATSKKFIRVTSVNSVCNSASRYNADMYYAKF